MNTQQLTGLPIANEKNLQDVIRQLSIFSSQGSHTYRDEVIEHLALNTLARFDPGGHSPGEVRSELKDMIGFDIDYEQIRSALCRLVSKETIYSTGDLALPHTKFGLKVESISSIKNNYKKQESFEQEVFESWRKEVKLRNPQITEIQLEYLKEDLQAFSLRLYSQHSVESLSLYSDDSEQVQSLLSTFLETASLNEILPPRDQNTHEIRLVELPRFFQSKSANRKRLITQQINQVFLLHLMQMDPTGANLVANEIEGGFLYLDTNILLRLFGLDGPDLQEATIRLLNLSRGLKYRSLVTPQTLAEYDQKIRSLMHNSRYFPRMSREQAQAALTYSGYDELSKHYWRQAAIGGVHIDPANVYEPYIHVEGFLKEYGIEIDFKEPNKLAKNQEQISKETSLLKSALDRDWKFDAIPEHDAFHRLLILHLRSGHENKSPLETTYWFLTSDTKLRHYDAIARKRQKLKVPFCVLTSQWMQILYPYRSTVEGFEETMAENLDSPLFRLFPSPPVELIHEIIQFMQMYKNLPDSVITKAIASHSFVRGFQGQGTETEKKALVEEFILGELGEIDSKLSDALNREKALQTDLEEAVFKLDKADTHYQSIQEQLHQSEQRRGELNDQLQKVKAQGEEITQRLNDSQKVQQQAQQEKEKLANQVDALSARLEEKSLKEKQVEDQLEQLQSKFAEQEQRAKEREQKIQLEQEQQLAWRRRTTKLFLVALTWIGAFALFAATNPLARDDELRWLALTYPVIALAISQFILVYGNWPSEVQGKLVFSGITMLNVVALVVAILKPFSVPISDAISWAVLIVQTFSGLFQMYSFQRQTKVQS